MNKLTAEERKAVLDLMSKHWNELDESGEAAFNVIAAGDDRRIFIVEDIDDDGEVSATLYWSMVDVLVEINRDRSGDWTPYIAEDWEAGWNEFVFDDDRPSLRLVKVQSPDLTGYLCARCKTPVEPTESDGYFAYCSEHDEDLYSFETVKDPLLRLPALKDIELPKNEQFVVRVEDLGNDEWSRPQLRNIETGAIYVDINCGDGEPDWHTTTDEGEPQSRIRKDVIFEIED